VVYFASLEKGWSSNAYGLAWLNKVFDLYTKTKAKQSRQLLIIDGHLLYINMAFLD
jgi:hypothetical protein